MVGVRVMTGRLTTGAGRIPADLVTSLPARSYLGMGLAHSHTPGAAVPKIPALPPTDN